MLTKQLLKYRKVRGSIKPIFIDPEDGGTIEFCRKMEDLYQNSVGKKYLGLKEKLKDLPNHPLSPSFEKLLDDRIEVDEPDVSIEEKRWDFLQVSSHIKKEQYPSLNEFQSALAEKLGTSFATVRDSLYADLPQNRLIASFRPLGAKMVPHRYNCALIQGLVMRSRFLEIEIDSQSLAEMRKIFRLMRFYRLLPLVKEKNQKRIVFSLSGPMSLFSSHQSYGIKLANFFPHLLFIKKWKIDGEVAYENKNYDFSCSHHQGVKSHYRDFGKGYIPKEFEKIAQAVGEKAGWSVALGKDFINLGGGHLCFPDFSFEHEKKGELHIELFHKWYQSELEKRIAGIRSQKKDRNLVLGICSSLKKPLSTVMTELEKDKGFRFFWFREFPTHRAILAQLS